MPAQQPAEYPNQIAGEFFPTTTSTDQQGLSFGFQASLVRVVNDRTTPVYVNLNSTTPSTGGFKTCSGETHQYHDFGCSGISLASTTTSTGGAGIRVGAWGA